MQNNCPACNSTNINYSFTSKSHQTLNKGNALERTPKDYRDYSFFQCHKCEAEFLNPVLSQKDYLDIYENVYQLQKQSQCHGQAPHKDLWSLKRRRLQFFNGQCSAIEKIIYFPLTLTVNYRIRLIKKYFQNHPIRLFDVGCGNGWFIETIQQYCYVQMALGMDFSSRAIEICKSKGITAVQGELRNIKERFNLITAIHVFEHIPDPRAFLKDIESKLEDDGILMLSLPNTRGLGKRIFGKNWVGFNVPRHVVNYNKKTLLTSLNLTNLEIIDYKTSEFYLDSLDILFNKHVVTDKFNFLHFLLRMAPMFLSLGDEQTLIIKKKK